MIDFQHLSILREVSRTGSVTAAAERLNVSQSALSHAIAKFEERHGIKVWMKDGRSLRFTQAGNYLLSLAERLLPQVEHAQRVLSDFADGRRGALRAGMECHPCQKWLMGVTGPYLRHWPDVDFEVCTAFRFDGVAALTGYEIDLLITPDPIDQPELLFTPVFDYELVLVLHEDHALANKPWADPHDLMQETLITVPVSLERLDIYSRFLVPANCRPHHRITAETTELMLQLTAAGRGISVLPEWLLQEEGLGLPLKALRIGPHGLHKSIHLGVRKAEAQIDYIAGFLDIARERQPA
ncbi:LysR family transcriptional regulator [Pseudomonas sp. Fig-3]|uniref:LysR family transcriptional regulator n=1 Tax=unclassified Pseudomonas TaxID=196821 RepID=UPI0011119D0E|nr:MULTISPECIES: LysR family transcriptional regulator [unclassified Pseudomonas]TNB81489.1 LysR family transcriptional regulator [Pseudomonas sp. Fig-3]